MTVDVDYDLDLELTRGRMDGSLIRSKARMLLDEFGMITLANILRELGGPASIKLDAIKQLVEIGDMKPKVNAPVATGTALNITFNMPPGVPPAPGMYNPLEAQPEAETLVIDLTPVVVEDELPPIPEGFKVPDFKLTNDLVGLPLPQNIQGPQR